MSLLFRLLVFLGSFLLFQVELIVARLLLPEYGSSAAVWTTCMMFYQGVLLLGYLYASRLSPLVLAGRYRWAHLAFVLLPAVTFPFHLRSVELHPIGAILVTLALSLGWPFLALSTTSLVAQAWLTRTDHPSRSDPAFLYGTSNAGALLAMLTFPFLVEPALDTTTQLTVWYTAYAAFVLLTALCIRTVRPAEAAAATSPPMVDAGVPTSATRAAGASRLAWLLLAAGANALLMAVTNVLTLDASMPLLWIVPLTLYLLTLIICFARKPLTATGLNRLCIAGLLVAGGAAVAALARVQSVLPSLALHGSVLWVGCLLLHANLARCRPEEPRLLGSYYLHMSVGGWLGTALIVLGVPLLLGSLAMAYVDYGIAGLLVLAALAARDAALQARGEARHRLAPLMAGGTAVVMAGILALAAVKLLHSRVDGSRTFYGLYTVKDENGLRHFQHGSTVHGIERLDAEARGEPLLYYHRGSPVGRVLTAAPPLQRVGAVGLGIGSLAAYGREGERWDFYELDPEVERLARSHFTLLSSSAATVRVITGDARLRMQEAEDQAYDVIILDAFSSDFVPTHLLTQEALGLYLRKLRPGGLLLFHISSRLFDLAPVLTRLGASLGLHSALSGDEVLSEEALARGQSPSRWFALTTSPDQARWLEDRLGWTQVRATEDLLSRRVWTDDYVNLLQALR
ncbi:fused MFS/spermidine synthase [Pyxidicoccus xibeiensis]|uniref:fused MFS/spermidine synthase n=1 Tax=Pyxidicoccus xibeiensis TaxID=2906759 RepID=UPI0020A74FA2|nr:fused MFS/spermidine synthase [Pyxidicoccus xibeiensis]MCP3140687.1 fused MFS/spermidine synthase [Pyxidicoccus xibeiensis]